MGLKLQSYPPCTLQCLQIQGYVLPKWWPCSANAAPARICKDHGVAHIFLGCPDALLWSCQDGRYIGVCSVARSHVDHFWHQECHLSHDGMQKRIPLPLVERKGGRRWSPSFIFGSTFLTSDNASKKNELCMWRVYLLWSAVPRALHGKRQSGVGEVVLCHSECRLHCGVSSSRGRSQVVDECDEENFKHHGILKGTAPTSSKCHPLLQEIKPF